MNAADHPCPAPKPPQMRKRFRKLAEVLVPVLLIIAAIPSLMDLFMRTPKKSTKEIQALEEMSVLDRYGDFTPDQTCRNSLGDVFSGGIGLMIMPEEESSSGIRYLLSGVYQRLTANLSISAGSNENLTAEIVTDNDGSLWKQDLSVFSGITTVDLDVSDAGWLEIRISGNPSGNLRILNVTDGYLYRADGTENRSAAAIPQREPLPQASFAEMVSVGSQHYEIPYRALDSDGNTVMNAMMLRSRAYRDREGYTEIYTCGGYDTLEAELRNKKGSASCTIEIYADNDPEKTLFRTHRDYDDGPLPISVDISGSRFLTIRVIADSEEEYAGILFCDAVLNGHTGA